MIGEAAGLEFVQPGQRPSAGRHNRMVRAIQAPNRGSTVYEDGTGTYVWPLLRRSVLSRWGKLDGTLTAGSTATVSFWEGANGEIDKWAQDSGKNVTAAAPPTLPSGRSIASGKWVKVERWATQWVVTVWEPEVITVLTDFQVDAANQELETKNRANVAAPFTDAESGWTVDHTGSVCP